MRTTVYRKGPYKSRVGSEGRKPARVRKNSKQDDRLAAHLPALSTLCLVCVGNETMHIRYTKYCKLVFFFKNRKMNKDRT